MICPFHNVPWWDSKLEPPTAHRDWYDRTFNFTWNKDGFSQLDYVLKGGDFVGTFLDETSKEGQVPLLTIRLNDGQMCGHKPTKNDDPSLVSNDHQFDRMSQFWYEHRSNASVILGLQEDPPVGWRPCCWIDDPHTKKPSCACPNLGCELSWLNSKVRARIINLIAELASMYIAKGLVGVSLDFERGLDYFPTSTSLAERRSTMRGFVRAVRGALDRAAAHSDAARLALGVRLSPHWSVLRSQGLDELALLVSPIESSGDGVTYITWGVFFFAYQPFDSELPSLHAATPPGTPTFYEVTSWTHEGPVNASDPQCRPAKVRVTKEELWTTALIARTFYGAQGVNAFNFVYTRPYYDEPCEYEPNMPYSEPLFADLGRTRNVTFLECCADQYYRLAVQHNPEPPTEKQLGGGGRPLPAGLYLTAVRPKGGWPALGRLRVRTDSNHTCATLSVLFNGHALTAAISNTSALFYPGLQPHAAVWPKAVWHAWEVPAAWLLHGNNTINVSAPQGVGDPSCESAKLVFLDLSLPVQSPPSAAGPSTVRPLRYNNDLTNTVSNDSPWHARGEPFSLELVEQSVRETASLGVTSHALAPGYCWVPWWNYTALRDHVDWWEKTFHGSLHNVSHSSGIVQTILAAGPKAKESIGSAFLEAARSAGQLGILSWRMQDVQFAAQGVPSSKVGAEEMSQFWWSHRNDPRFMALGSAWNSSAANPETSAAMSWANPRVVTFHLSLLSGALKSESWDGAELDFLRTPHYFPPSTPPAKRAAVMLDFIAAVRAELPPPASLGLRLPPSRSLLSRLGLNLTDLAPLVDWFNFGMTFYSYQPIDSDFASLASQLSAAYGWSGGARLRFACDEHSALPDLSRLAATINGVTLRRIPNVSEPFASAVPSFWPPSAFAAFEVPLSALREETTSSVTLEVSGVPDAEPALVTTKPMPCPGVHCGDRMAGRAAAPSPTPAVGDGEEVSVSFPPPPPGTVRIIYADLAVGL